MISMSTAVAASVAALAVGIGSCAPTTPTRPRPNVAGGPTTSATTPSIQPTTTPPTTPPSKTATPTTATVPVYYLGANDKLYREFHPATVGNGGTAAKVRAAIALMLDGRTAFDPDYSSQWPASASVRSVSVAGGVATVDLHGATVNGYDPAGNRAALQQLIWTATGVLRWDRRPVALRRRRALHAMGESSAGRGRPASRHGGRCARAGLGDRPAAGRGQRRVGHRPCGRHRLRRGDSNPGTDIRRHSGGPPTCAADGRRTGARHRDGHTALVTRPLHDRGVLSRDEHNVRLPERHRSTHVHRPVTRVPGRSA